MIRIYTSRSLFEVDFIRSLLEADGIPTVLKNEFGAHTAGGGFGAMAFSWPEIWIDPQHAEQARTLIADYHAQRLNKPPTTSTNAFGID